MNFFHSRSPLAPRGRLRIGAALALALWAQHVPTAVVTETGSFDARSAPAPAAAVAAAPSFARCNGFCSAGIRRDSVLQHAESTYIAPVVDSDSVIRRWEDREEEPVRVWISVADSIPLWRPQLVLAAAEGFRRWEGRGAPVRFTVVDDSTAAEVRVRWAERLSGNRLGLMVWRATADGWLRGGDVVLALRDFYGTPIGDGLVAAVATHEAGHVLGLEHSSDAADIMAPTVHLQRMSPRDVRTLRILYSLPVGRVD